MDKNTVLTMVELFISLVIEGVVLSFIFMWISNKAQTKNEQQLKNEMANIEKQNKFDFEQLQNQIQMAKSEVISQVKESRK